MDGIRARAEAAHAANAGDKKSNEAAEKRSALLPAAKPIPVQTHVEAAKKSPNDNEDKLKALLPAAKPSTPVQTHVEDAKARESNKKAPALRLAAKLVPIQTHVEAAKIAGVNPATMQAAITFALVVATGWCHRHTIAPTRN